MQIHRLYSVFDEKASAFARLFAFSQDGEALRAFGETVNDPKTSLASHPGDFKLYRMGTFDDASGMITPEKQPVFLANATDFVAVAAAR